MNYSETKRIYLEHRKNIQNAEKDEMNGSLMQTKPKPPKMTPKREKILFVRDYMKEYGKITDKGLARKHENIFRNTKRKPDKQLVKDFAVILTDLVDMGILKKYGISRGSISYVKVINPDKLEGLRNE